MAIKPDQLIEAVNARGGPSQFTIDFLRSIKGKQNADLNERQLEIKEAVMAKGSENFVQALRDRFGLKDQDLTTSGGAKGFLDRGAEGIIAGGEAISGAGTALREASEGRPVATDTSTRGTPLDALPGSKAPVLAAANAVLGAVGFVGGFAGSALELGGQLISDPGRTAAGIGVAISPVQPVKSDSLDEPSDFRLAVPPLAKAIGQSFAESVGEFARDPARALTERPIETLGGPLIDVTVGFGIARLGLRGLSATARAAISVTERARRMRTPVLDRPIKVRRFRDTVDQTTLARGPFAGTDKINPDTRRLAAEEITKLTNETGGATVNLTRGNQIGQDLVSVGLFPERTRQIPNAAKVTPKEIDAFIVENRDLLRDPRLSVGTFVDKESKLVDLDIVGTFDEVTGTWLGRLADQKSVFHLKRFEEIATGGTGLNVPQTLKQFGPIKNRLDNILKSGTPRALLAETPVREMQNNQAIAVGGAVAEEAMNHPISRLLNSTGGGTNNLVPAAESFSKLRGIWDEFILSTQPKLLNLVKNFPDFVNIAVRSVAARPGAQVAAQIHLRRINRILLTAEDQELFWRHMNQLQGQSVPGSRIPTLTADELARIAEPQFIAARAYYRGQITPEMEALAPDAGIDKFVRVEMPGEPGSLYMKLNPVNLETGLDGAGRPIARGQRVQTSVGEGGGRGPFAFSKSRAQAARQRTGRADAYSVDGGANLTHMYEDRLSAAWRNRLIDRMKKFKATEEEITANPNGFARVFVPKDAGKAFGTADHTAIMVPKPVARAYNDILKPYVMGAETEEQFQMIRRGMTQIALAGPADASSHFFRLVGALYSQRGMGSNFGAFGRVIANLPGTLPRFAVTMAEIFNVHGAEATARAASLARVGAIRTSFFDETARLKNASMLQKANPLTFFKRLFFENPDLEAGNLFGGRGLMGMEVRTRIVMDKFLERMRPNMTPSERGLLINNQFGTYVKGLRPTLVNALRNSIGFGDPFAAAGVALTKTQTKALFGADAMGVNFETLWSTIDSAIITPIVANAMLNDGRMPWEIPDLKPGDVRIQRDDGTALDVPARMLMISTIRGSHLVGLRGAWGEYINGRQNIGSLLLAGSRDSLNVLLARIGPLERALFTAQTGKVPFLTDQGLMQKARQSTSQLTENIRAALAGTLQLPEAYLGFDESMRMTPDTMAGKAVLTIGETLGLVPRLRPPLDERESAQIRRARGKFGAIAREVGFIAQRKFALAEGRGEDFEPVEFIELELQNRGINIDSDEGVRALSAAIRMFTGRARSIGRTAEEVRDEAISIDDFE